MSDARVTPMPERVPVFVLLQGMNDDQHVIGTYSTRDLAERAAQALLNAVAIEAPPLGWAPVDAFPGRWWAMSDADDEDEFWMIKQTEMDAPA